MTLKTLKRLRGEIMTEWNEFHITESNGKFGIVSKDCLAYEHEFNKREHAEAILRAHKCGAKSYTQAVRMIRNEEIRRELLSEGIE